MRKYLEEKGEKDREMKGGERKQIQRQNKKRRKGKHRKQNQTQK